jgi:hypothetical protein
MRPGIWPTKQQRRASHRWVLATFFAPVVIVWLGTKAWWKLQERLRNEENEAYGLQGENNER